MLIYVFIIFMEPLRDLQIKKRCLIQRHLQEDICEINYPFNLSSGDTESFFLPFALRAARTLLPLGVDILSLKPCLFTLFLLDGW